MTGELALQPARLSDLDAGTVAVIPVFTNDDLSDVLGLDDVAGGAPAAALGRGEIKGSLYATAFFHSVAEKPGILYVGAGDREDFQPLILFRLASAATRYLVPRGYVRVAFVDRGDLPPFVFGHAAAQGAIMGPYDPGLKKARKEPAPELAAVFLCIAETDEAMRGAALGQIVGECATVARDLVNAPPNDLTPTVFAERAERMGREHGLGVTVFDEARMRELGMGSLLGVAAGSDQPPRLIELRYGNPDAPVKLALVGKGLTFDSGGLSIKTAAGMETMKSDMGGGAAVVAGMLAVARMAPKNISVTGYVGATENMPGGSAMRPGDVLTAMNGVTIEVLNTDAEGRLVLADVLGYAVKQGATHIVDFATLTGGAVVALGFAATLAAGRPADWVARVVQAADLGLERAWQMPLYDEYRRAMDSDVADIKNSGGRWGSALTATAFLSEFAGDVDWTHMDIAGTAFAEESSAFRPTGGTGEGVGTIAALVRMLTEQEGSAE